MLLSLLLLAAPSVGCRPETVVAGDEVVRDGEEVLGKLALRVGACAVVTCAENHELHASLRKEPFHELEGKAAQAVAVGNHNCRDLAAMDEFQKPLEAGAVPVEAGPDVCDDEVGIGALLLEVGGLALEVAALVLGRDAGVADDVFVRCCAHRCSRDVSVLKDGGNVGGAVAADPAGGADASDLALLVPAMKCRVRNMITMANFAARQVPAGLMSNSSRHQQRR